jgi:hypothetical protein
MSFSLNVTKQQENVTNPQAIPFLEKYLFSKKI